MLGRPPRAGPVAVGARVLLMIVACAGATAFSLSEWRVAGIGSPIWWPTVGVAVLIMLRSPRRWWWLLTAAFVVGYLLGNRHVNSWSVGLTYVAAGTAELLVASLVLAGRRRVLAWHTGTTAAGARFVVAAVASIALGSAVIVVGAALQPAARGAYAFLPGYILSHAIGLLVVAPLLLPLGHRRPGLGHVAEFVMTVAVVSAAGVGAFVLPTEIIRSFLVLAPVVWAAIRLDAVLATLVTAVASGLAAYGTAHQQGAFAVGSTVDQQLTAQLFVATAAATCLALVLITRHRAQLADRVQDSENTLRVAVRDAQAGMYSLRFDPGHVGEIRDANAALCTMLGYTPDELNGQHCRVLGLGPDYATAAPPEQVAGFNGWIEAFAHGEPSSFRRETPFYTKDGELRWVEVSATRVLPERRPTFALIHVYDLTSRAAQHRRLEHMALRDALTGLANRALLFRRVAESLNEYDERRGPGLLYVDLDEFKAINDTFGHAVGDAVLVDVAVRLIAAVRPGDTVARLGGDEFAILCAPTDAAELDRIAQRIRAGLADPVLLDDTTEIAISASIGSAIANGGSGGTMQPRDADTLVRAADAAMYADKQRLVTRHGAPSEV